MSARNPQMEFFSSQPDSQDVGETRAQARQQDITSTAMVNGPGTSFTILLAAWS